MRRTLLVLDAIIKLNPEYGRNLAVMAAGLSPAAILGCFAMYELFERFSAAGRPDLVLAIPFSLAVSSSITLAFGRGIMDHYCSQRTELFMHLPFAARHIVAARYLESLIQETVMAAFTIAPFVSLYGYLTGAGPAYYAAAFFTTASLVAFIQAAALPPVIFAMRFSNSAPLRPFKSAFVSLLHYADLAFVGTGAAIACVVLFQFKPVLDAVFLKGPWAVFDVAEFLFSEKSGFAVRAFTRVLGATDALVMALTCENGKYSILMIFFLCALAAISIAATLALADRWFIEGFSRIREGGPAAGPFELSAMARRSRRKSRFSALLWHETAAVLRTPVFFKLCFLVNFVTPAVIAFALLVLAASTGGRFYRAASSLFSKVSGTDQFALYLHNFFVYAALFTASSSAIASTAFAREGRAMRQIAALPFSFAQLAAAKGVFAFALNYSSVLLSAAFVFPLTGAPASACVPTLINSALATLFMTAFGLYSGLRFAPPCDETDYPATRKGRGVNLTLAAALFAALAVNRISAMAPGPAFQYYATGTFFAAAGAFFCHSLFRYGKPMFDRA